MVMVWWGGICDGTCEEVDGTMEWCYCVICWWRGDSGREIFPLMVEYDYCLNMAGVTMG